MIVADCGERTDGVSADFRFGTHRLRSPAATLAVIGPIAAHCGVTRLGDVTGLDTIGIPVFQAIRPLARSLSVSQGKGATRVAARVSALMEAIELHHAEIVRPAVRDSAKPGDCARDASIMATDWCRGADLLSGRPTRVPHAIVSMDFSRGGSAPYLATSNGLASGNDRTEAIVSGLCEVIERDAQSRWLGRSSAARHDGAVDLDTITVPLGRRLIRRIIAAGLGVRIWSFGEDHCAAAIACAIYERSAYPVLPPVMGAGAHLDPSIALARAVTEAAQARATLIAGARDDLTDGDYAKPEMARLSFLTESFGHGPPRRPWSSLPSRATGCLARDRDTLLAGAEAAGAKRVACVDLADPDLPIAVVKIVVPGFLGHADPQARDR